MQPVPDDGSAPSSSQALDLSAHARVFELAATPIWMYDSSFCHNVWGNKAAFDMFGVTEAGFQVVQFDQLGNWSPEQLRLWKKLNAQIHLQVEVERQEMSLTVTSTEPVPGFLRISKAKLVLKAVFRHLTVIIDGAERAVTFIQVVNQSFTDLDDNHLRMVEICNNHPMFQFLFDESGKLLAANKRAMYNMREHLGSNENYNLRNYLGIGECDTGVGPEDMYLEAMDAIFKQNKLCHRFAQLRWSKRHPGKYRWVLYEMWPLQDPVTHQRAVLVCEQNISQVKALEEQFKKQNQRLEAQLEEALAQRDSHKPAIDIDTPADKTLKLLDKIMRGQDVSAKEAMELRDAIQQAGDLRQPVNFNEQLMKNSQTVLDNEVSQSLIQLLSSKRPAKIKEEEDVEGEGGANGEHDLRYIYARQNVTQESVKALIAMQKNLPDQVMGVLAKVDDWQFDAFKLDEVSGGRPLSLLSFALLKRSEVVDKFQLDEHKLVKFLMRIEDGYPSNPYHNRIHAADVLQSLHVLVVRGGLINNGYCDETALMSCYLSAIIHDFDHRGVNNDYLTRVSDGLAILYNDRSPMENHHLASAFQLMNSDEYNFLRKMPHKIKESLRKQIIEMVLATDMKQHFAIHSMFQAKMQLNGSRPSGGNSGGKGLRGPSLLHSNNANGGPNTNSMSGVPSGSGTGGGSSFSGGPDGLGGGAGLGSGGSHKAIDEDQKSLCLQVALKCADLGHLASPRNVHKKWVQYLEEEFFRQGDREKQNALTVSPLMDREKNGITKSQVGFFDIVALPLFQSFAQALPDATPMLDAVKDNYAMWREDATAYSTTTSQNTKSSR